MRKTRRSGEGTKEQEIHERIESAPPLYGQREVAAIGFCVVLIGAGWVWYAWAQAGGSLDTTTLATGGLFLFTLLVAWRSFEIFLATLRKHFELQRGLARFDAKLKRLNARLEHLPRS